MLLGRPQVEPTDSDRGSGIVGAHFHQEVALVAGHSECSMVIPGGVSAEENSLTNAVMPPTPLPQKVSINYLWLSSPISCILMF